MVAMGTVPYSLLSCGAILAVVLLNGMGDSWHQAVGKVAWGLTKVLVVDCPEIKQS